MRLQLESTFNVLSGEAFSELDVCCCFRLPLQWMVAQTLDAVEKLVAARVASLSTRRVERFENSCIGSVRVIPL
jgi:hypothetical protein